MTTQSEALQPVHIDSITIHKVVMPLVEPLRTSFGLEAIRPVLLVEVRSGDLVGWGECTAAAEPGYCYETVGTAYHILTKFLIPALVGQTITRPEDTGRLMAGVRGHPLTKAALDSAVWELLAQANGQALADLIWSHHVLDQPRKDRVTVGVSIGIQPTIDETLAIIEKRLKEGYRRIKLKIKPGWDVELAAAVRSAYPDIALMLDANSAYTLADADHLKQLDRFNLLMLEQPLAHDDIYEHSKLQPQLETPICLDESIHTVNDVRLALALGACRIINLKPPRVGGLTEAAAIHKLCYDEGIPLWIGGMLETGIGRAQNIAVGALPGVTLPSDLSATNRYYDPDITEPPFVLNPDSTIDVPAGVGTGIAVQRDRLKAFAARWDETFPDIM
ncbi:MAG: o-succinylbenzoate synthase [Anaerolineae bacterium]